MDADCSVIAASLVHVVFASTVAAAAASAAVAVIATADYATMVVVDSTPPPTLCSLRSPSLPRLSMLWLLMLVTLLCYAFVGSVTLDAVGTGGLFSDFSTVLCPALAPCYCRAATCP